VRGQLGRFGSRATRRPQVGDVGGEKTGCCCRWRRGNAPPLLLTRRTTNHLDMDARAPGRCSSTTSGCVDAGSHDRSGDRWSPPPTSLGVAGGKVTPFDGDMRLQAKLLLRNAKRRQRRARPPNVQRGTRTERERRARARGSSQPRLPPPRIRAKQSPTREPRRAPLKKTWKPWKNSARVTSRRRPRRPGLRSGSYAIPRSKRRRTYSATRSGWRARSPTRSMSGGGEGRDYERA